VERAAPFRALGGEALRERIARALLALAVAAGALPARAQDEPAPDPLAEIEALEPNDPLFNATGSWGQVYEDQWALRRIGCVEMGAGRSAWDAQTGADAPIVVAVIDTGIDYTHPDLPLERLWSNPREQPNGLDDDSNGRADDLHGWNFADGDARPWDDSGHGTYLAGIIAAATHNGTGMAGVNRGARILALKVLDAEGFGTPGALAAALDYAASAGARVILLGFPWAGAGEAERAALGSVLAAGALVVAPAGDTSEEIGRDALAAVPGVLTVGGSDRADARVRSSGWGSALGLVAPGVDVLGPRARGTDWLAGSGAAQSGSRAAQVGEYYRASGSAPAAALAAGAASLLWAARPNLSAAEVARVLRQNARDLGPPGLELQTGYGRLDVRAALVADPDFFLEARIDSVQAAADGAPRLRVAGSADADVFQNARLQIAPASDPERWIQVGGPLNSPVRAGTLAEIDATLFDGEPRWLLRVVTRHASGAAREARFALDLGW
jgi:subtilisin family serine protease